MTGQQVEDGGRAIETNDYLMIGATLGLPAMACLLVGVVKSLSRGSRTAEGDGPEGEDRAFEARWMSETCRSAATVAWCWRRWATGRPLPLT